MSKEEIDLDTSIFSNLPSGALRLLQITDSHLYADPAGCLLGLNTLQSLDGILEIARTRSPLDMILATGDMVHDGTSVGYNRLHDRLSALQVPTYCLPGNHDIPAVMKKSLDQELVRVTASAQQEDWSLVFLDSTLPDHDGGHLSDGELEILSDSLQTHRDKHALVCLHHHPVPIGSAWMDKMALDNPEAFFDVIDQNPQVRGIIWGHIHQVFESARNGVRLIGSPSTCIQFAPGQDSFGLDTLTPGLRWLALLPNGEIRTQVERLEAYRSEIDLRSTGY